MGTTFDRVMREQGRQGRWMARQTGVSDALVTYIRKGERVPSPEFRRKAAEALGVDESVLFPDAEQAVA